MAPGTIVTRMWSRLWAAKCVTSGPGPLSPCPGGEHENGDAGIVGDQLLDGFGGTAFADHGLGADLADLADAGDPGIEQCARPRGGLRRA